MWDTFVLYIIIFLFFGFENMIIFVNRNSILSNCVFLFKFYNFDYYNETTILLSVSVMYFFVLCTRFVNRNYFYYNCLIDFGFLNCFSMQLKIDTKKEDFFQDVKLNNSENVI